MPRLHYMLICTRQFYTALSKLWRAVLIIEQNISKSEDRLKKHLIINANPMSCNTCWIVFYYITVIYCLIIYIYSKCHLFRLAKTQSRTKMSKNMYRTRTAVIGIAARKCPAECRHENITVNIHSRPKQTQQTTTANGNKA